MINLGSGQAILLIIPHKRSNNRCFQTLYLRFWPQNGSHRERKAREADKLLPPLLLFLPLIVFLTGSARDEFHGTRDNISITIVDHEQVNVVGSDHIVQDCQTIASSGLIKPLKPSSPVLRKLQEKFPLMTSVGDMPDVSRNIVSFCSCHGFPLIILFLPLKSSI